MKGLLVRVGADQGKDNGRFNAPVHTGTREFCYVPIPEEPNKEIKQGMERPYTQVSEVLPKFDIQLPTHLGRRRMHLDPDFENLTYGDQGCKGCRIWKKKDKLDFLVFYAALKDIHRHSERLIYAIIGFYWVEHVVKAVEVPPNRHNENAHTRYLQIDENEIVVRAKREGSGRLKQCITIGDYRANANNLQGRAQYRVKENILEAWGGLSVSDGWLQRSAYIPEFKDADKFLAWFRRCNPSLIAQNN
ncbi:MAG TPA: hypothetical protein ENI81_03775 [Phycisphaerales bacterium]|nr:hypothetical protein [Phycisphaerales bacterium]